jgi:hypothetical protein
MVVPTLEWRQFFERFGECPTTNGIPAATLEQIYEAFRARLMNELLVDVHGTSHYGILVKRDE